MFIEKPLSADSVENALSVSRQLVDSKTVVSVGYFLRYLKGAFSALLSFSALVRLQVALCSRTSGFQTAARLCCQARIPFRVPY
jgi:hypothetical protein